MLITKKMTETRPAFTPPVKFLGLDANLIKQFQKLATALNTMEDFKLPKSVAEFVRCLVMSTEPENSSTSPACTTSELYTVRSASLSGCTWTSLTFRNS